MRRFVLAISLTAAVFCVLGCGGRQVGGPVTPAGLRHVAAARVTETEEHDPAGEEGTQRRFRREPARGVGLFEPAADAEAKHKATLLFAPAAEQQGTADRAPAPAATEGDRWWQRPLAGRSPGEVVRDDIALLPRELWKSTKDSANVRNLLILSAAGGLSAVSRGSWDHRVDRSMSRQDDSLFDKEGDFGSVAGNPLLHFGFALATYGYSVQAGDDELYGFSKTLFQALALNGMATVGLKLAANDYSPNGEWPAWPSGHTSSTATVAAVAWEHYGWKVGAPLYALTGWVGTSRIDDREHWLSDVIFGAALGSVIGHSVARGRELEVGGFTVLPYAHPEGGAGVAFARQF